MGRIRTIKPEFHAHEELSGLPAETHLFAGALVNYADDEGYFNANPVLVKAGTNPLRSDRTPIETQLEQLVAIGYLEIRQSGLKHYGRICKFDEHQRVSHKVPSKIKDRFESLPKFAGGSPEDRRPELKGIELNREQGREASTATAVPAGKLVCTLPLIDKTDHSVFEADVQEWQALYLAVDVRQELRNLKGWLIGNPKLRKTKSGVGRFINSWLSRAQNEAKPGAVNANRSYSKTGGNLTAAAGAFAILEQAERNSSATDEVQPETGGSGESGDLSHLRAGSIEL